MSEDLISRQAAINAISHNKEVYSKNFGDDPIDKYTIAIIDNDAQTIAQLPSAERRGRWIDIPFTARWICSNCDYISEFASFKYCPDCGTRMDLEDENDEK